MIRFLTAFLTLLVLGVTLALLAGCAGPKQLKGSGIEVPAHPSYIKLCKEHPEVEACREVR